MFRSDSDSMGVFAGAASPETLASSLGAIIVGPPKKVTIVDGIEWLSEQKDYGPNPANDCSQGGVPPCNCKTRDLANMIVANGLCTPVTQVSIRGVGLTEAEAQKRQSVLASLRGNEVKYQNKIDSLTSRLAGASPADAAQIRLDLQDARNNLAWVQAQTAAIMASDTSPYAGQSGEWLFRWPGKQFKTLQDIQAANLNPCEVLALPTCPDDCPPETTLTQMGDRLGYCRERVPSESLQRPSNYMPGSPVKVEQPPAKKWETEEPLPEIPIPVRKTPEVKTEPPKEAPAGGSFFTSPWLLVLLAAGAGGYYLYTQGKKPAAKAGKK